MNRRPMIMLIVAAYVAAGGCHATGAPAVSHVPVLTLRADGLLLPSPTRATAEAEDRGVVPKGELEVIARFGDLGPSGIAVAPSGAVFVGFPRHADDHAGPTLGKLEAGMIVPFPDAAMSLPSTRPASSRLVSVHGMTTDSSASCRHRAVKRSIACGPRSCSGARGWEERDATPLRSCDASTSRKFAKRRPAQVPARADRDRLSLDPRHTSAAPGDHNRRFDAGLSLAYGLTARRSRR